MIDEMIKQNNNAFIVENFSANNFCCDKERKELENKYKDFLVVTDKFTRDNVSNKLCKNSFITYKEAFSNDLVKLLLDELNVEKGSVVLDPFVGSSTTAIECLKENINCIGLDIMPTSKIIAECICDLKSYNVKELILMLEEIKQLELPKYYRKKVPFVTITQHAYPNENDKFIRYVSDFILNSDYSSYAKNVFILSVLNSLEECSYTIKDGQYLGWDSRSKKLQLLNKKRLEKGLEPYYEKIIRKKISNAKEKIISELKSQIDKISYYKEHFNEDIKYRFINDSSMFKLQFIDSNSIDAVITSPPYCNRYDYTRTYALELAYLGIDDNEIKSLRQSLLSCTVENKSKLENLKDYYKSINALDRYNSIVNILNKNNALNEIILALKKRREHKDLNNRGVIQMVEGYFTELAFVFSELFRVCKDGSYVAFVNDNVRYGGEVIPVDFLSTSLAESFGFKCKCIYTLKQQKGNSSQQMAKFGRVPLRKSITIWQK